MNSAIVILVVMIVVLLLLLSTGMWIGASVGLLGVILLVFFVGGERVSLVGQLQFNMLNIFTYTCLPLFIFMGEIVLYSGVSQKLYSGASTWLGILPGGLLHANIASCALFAAISGSTMATAATVGLVAIPEMERRGYDKKLLLGSLASGGTLGILIPPSTVMIIYGAFVSESVGQLFIGGMLPGIALAGLFMLYIGVRAALQPHLMPPREKVRPKVMLLGLVGISPMAVLIIIVLGSIYLGVATPTEAAAIGVVGALAFCALYRKLTLQVLKTAGLAALQVTCWLMFIVIGASVLSAGLSFLHVPRDLVEMVGALAIDRVYIFMAICLLYIVLGCFIDGLSMMLVTLPVVYPLAMSLGFNSIWLGIILVLLIEMGSITPPFGVNLYVIHGISGKKYLKEIILGSLPFVFVMNVMVAILYICPSLVLWLPGQMIQKF